MLAAVIVMALTLPVTRAGLGEGKTCGATICEPLEYCDPFSHQCANCAIICEDSNNSDKTLCNKLCQGNCFIVL